MDNAAAAEVDIERKKAFLAEPRAYPQATRSVERIETHLSWVFLTDGRVYKMKKPVRGEGFDFSTCEGRRRNAEAELRLNRRLARAVYLGVRPLTLDPARGLAIGGGGATVDWLVEMVRLPAANMLDRRLARGDWRRSEIEALADRLARFFTGARRVYLDRVRYLERFHRECRASALAFALAAAPAQRHLAVALARRLRAFIARRADLLLRRLHDGWLVEGHGDLRPEHICLGPSPAIIDCLEFRADLRLLDPVEELAFLDMECARLGAPDIGPILLRCYRRRTADRPPPLLISFYKALNALIRARIAIVHLREDRVDNPKKWPRRAAQYLAIARREARRLDR
jgi:aminoglycoside phosphotransferase family enzyme